MKRLRSMWFVLLLSMLGGTLTWGAAQPGNRGDLGLGLIIGEPTGVTGKYWLSTKTAIDGAMAWNFGDDDRFQIHADHLWHIDVPSMHVPSGRVPFYVGGGVGVIAGKHSEGVFRIPLGLTWLSSDAPIEVFAEIVPVVEFAPDTDADLNGGIGIRYYFK